MVDLERHAHQALWATAERTAAGIACKDLLAQAGWDPAHAAAVRCRPISASVYMALAFSSAMRSASSSNASSSC